MYSVEERLAFIFDPDAMRYEESIAAFESWIKTRTALISGSEARWLVQMDLNGSVVILDQIGPQNGNKHIVGK